jgi:HD superfamily phosphodiesterase
MQNKYLKLKKFFTSYTAQFNLKKIKDQKNIDLKIDHSIRVVENMDEITDGMQLSENDKYSADIIALLHDIGRFKQYQKYKTFSDYKSEDHGILGVKLIKKKYLLDDLNWNKKQIIYKAIQQHNKADLNKEVFNNESELFFAKLIRDADKLDILKIFVDRYKKGSQKDYIHKLSETPKINNHIYEKILKKESINYDKLQTINDLKAMQLGWLYDINFKETMDIIKKRKYIEVIYNSMDPNQRAAEIYEQVKKDFF